ncbi:MAG: PhoH family protein [Burkholderiaceae bacterium]|jgi:PhoH-like ATPase|nr:PhoH family protein [Burkholderiales bacterium]MCZ8336617.1 PhoH family protein [Burkholderiaceae bacterium]
MPLPKAPTKPATLLDLTTAVLARATRPKGRGAAGATPDQVPSPEPVARDAAIAPREAANRAGVAGRIEAVPVAPEPAARAPAPVLPAPSRQRSANVAALPVGGGRAVRRAANEQSRLFVLDTNVLMHDPTSLFRFAEHDVFLPIVTLEELDNHKKGMSEVARNARQVSRSLDAMVADVESGIEQGIPLDKLGNRDATGRLFLQTQALTSSLPESLAAGKADNQILGVVRALQHKFPDRQTVLVSKDINMRIKARALGLPAEDYQNDQVVDDLDMLYAGTLALPPDFWDTHGKGMESWQQGGSNWYRLSGPAVAGFMLNQFVYLDGDLPLSAQVKERNGKTAVLQTLRDFTHLKNAVWGVTARNREQNFALNLLTNPEIDFVTLLGQAGTGKTLLALAAGLAQTLEQKRYTEIIVTRATVPVGDDIGYLPGTEEEKMQPWMGALEDNLEVLTQGNGTGGEWGRAAATDLIRSRIKVKALSFMRGRTFMNKWLIIDEAQNLTPKQMKTLVTRAGPGTKVICLGNIAQIDTPYLTEASSGLTYVVDRFKGWAHAGHVTLQRGERSRLADFAADAL